MKNTTTKKLQQLIQTASDHDLSLSIDRRDSSFLKNYMKASVPTHSITIKSSNLKDKGSVFIMVENNSIDEAVSIAHKKLQKSIIA